MKSLLLTNIRQAHNCLGIVVSSLLFIVFFAGSISLFKSEINLWSLHPHFIEVSHLKPISVSEVMAKIHHQYKLKTSQTITIIKPDSKMPFYQAYLQIKHPDYTEKKALYVSPSTGQILAEQNDFYLSKFIYQLHKSLNLPTGTYLIGIVSLFFLVALISGFLLHAKNLFRDFFNYRNNANTSRKLLNAHTVIGVTSLPFTLMYAITGLVFNLIIIYQIVLVTLVYNGDKKQLLEDVGYYQVTSKNTGEVWENINNINKLENKFIEKVSSEPNYIKVHHYGDKAAVIQFRTTHGKQLTTHTEAFYHVDTQELLHLEGVNILNNNKVGTENTFKTGIEILSQLHFANYAGTDLRLLYFVLGLSVCGLIITGNLLWIKKLKSRITSTYALNFINNLTLVTSFSVPFSVATIFLVERILSIQLLNRGDYLVYSFSITLLLITSILFTLINNKRILIKYTILAVSFMLFIVVITDWIMFYQKFITLWQHNYTSAIYVNLTLFIIALLLLTIGNKFTGKKFAEHK